MTIVGLIIYFLFSVPLSGTPDLIIKDSLKVVITGSENLVEVNDSLLFPGTVVTDTLRVAGEIVQTGENNRVEIHSPASDNKRISNRIHISQTGKNNKIKINSK